MHLPAQASEACCSASLSLSPKLRNQSGWISSAAPVNKMRPAQHTQPEVSNGCRQGRLAGTTFVAVKMPCGESSPLMALAPTRACSMQGLTSHCAATSPAPPKMAPFRSHLCGRWVNVTVTPASTLSQAPIPAQKSSRKPPAFSSLLPDLSAGQPTFSQGIPASRPPSTCLLPSPTPASCLAPITTPAPTNQSRSAC